MCGDCTEPVVLNIIESYEPAMSEDGSINLLDLMCFWQEVPDFFAAIAQKDNHVVIELRRHLSYEGDSGDSYEFNEKIRFLKIALCHLIERFLFDGFNEILKSKIMNFFGAEFVGDYLNTTNNWAGDTFWESLWKADTFSSKENWEKFTKEVTENIREAEILLEEYLRRCTSEPDDPVEKEFPRSAWNFLTNSLPAIYYSLCIMARDDPQHTLLRRMALAAPGICDFAGEAYWLARKAFICCLQEQGVSFITKNFSSLRYFLIGYAVLKVSIPVAELHMLRTQIQLQENFLLKQIEQSDLLKIIDNKIYQLKHELTT